MAIVAEGSFDQGFSWIIMIASFLCQAIINGILYSMGILYVMVDSNLAPHSHAELSLVFSLSLGSFGIACAVGGLLGTKFGCRIVAILGGVISCIGLVLSSFATTTFHLCLTYGIIAGSGFGFGCVASTAIIGSFFRKYLSIAYGVASSGCGVGTLVFPPLIQYLEDIYGWRSTFLLCGAFSLNIVVCGALYRPVDVKDRNEDGSKGSGMGMYLHIFKNKSYIFLCIHNMLTWIGITIAYLHLPPYAISIGLSNYQSATLASVIGMSNFFGRLTFGLLNNLECFTPIGLLIIGFLGAGITTTLIPLFNNFIWLGCCSAGFGFLWGTFGAIFPQVVLSLLDINLLTVAYGYTFLFNVIGCLSGGPLSGILLDTTNYYPSTLYLGGGCLIIGAAIMVIPWVWLRRKQFLPLDVSDEEKSANV